MDWLAGTEDRLAAALTTDCRTRATASRVTKPHGTARPHRVHGSDQQSRRVVTRHGRWAGRGGSAFSPPMRRNRLWGLVIRLRIGVSCSIVASGYIRGSRTPARREDRPGGPAHANTIGTPRSAPVPAGATRAAAMPGLQRPARAAVRMHHVRAMRLGAVRLTGRRPGAPRARHLALPADAPRTPARMAGRCRTGIPGGQREMELEGRDD